MAEVLSLQCLYGLYHVFRILRLSLPEVYKTAALPLSYASLRAISPTYVKDVNRMEWDWDKIVVKLVRGVGAWRSESPIRPQSHTADRCSQFFVLKSHLKPRCSMPTEPTCS